MQWRSLIPTWAFDAMGDVRLAMSEVQAGVMMAILVIPQSLGYAALAGLPPIMGLYTAIVPVMVYAWINSSSTSSVGPVAITAIMTAGALSNYAGGSLQYIQLAVTLACMVGMILCLSSIMRLGWIMQFVSRGVSAGFISGAAVLIMFSQVKHLLGIPLVGDNLMTLIATGMTNTKPVHTATIIVGLGALLLLIISRYGSRIVWGWLPAKYQGFANRFFVIVLVAASIWLSHHWGLGAQGVNVLSDLPTGLPSLTLPTLSISTLLELLPSALLIALVAFISSSTIASQQARLRKEPYSDNKELLGLGLANVASGLFGGFAVASGISRTGLNLSVGSKSQLSSMVCAFGVLLIVLFLGQMLVGLPYAILAAIITSSVISMVDIETLKQAWRLDKIDALCFIITFIICIVSGLNMGLVAGLLASFALMVYRTHKVHIATLGRVGDSEHFRNIERHQVTTFDGVLLLRIDESLYFGNAKTVHDDLLKLIESPDVRDVVLVMTAVNHIDLSAQEMLEDLNQECRQQDKCLHLAEVKGPVMDVLAGSPVMQSLSGQVFLSVNLAVQALKRS